MTTSTSRHAYADCFELFDKALEKPNGIGITAETQGAAMQLRNRLHYARTLDRQKSMEIYPVDDPSFGTSPYDCLIVRVREKDGWWVYIEPRKVTGRVVELGAAE